MVFFDFSKAFDVVNHVILFDKLKAIGVRPPPLDWIWSFLSDRHFKVSAAGECSDLYAVTSGVPQGSVLGPLLFLLYVNHVTAEVSNNFKLFADDLKLYIQINHTTVCEAMVDLTVAQSNIDLIVSTAESWGLQMNVNKCAVLRIQRRSYNWNLVGIHSNYYLNNAPISFVNVFSDLGVTVDNSLKFHQHIHNIVSKAAALSNNLLKSTVCRSPSFMISLYKTHIRPLLEFSSCLRFTGYTSDNKLLESAQRRWTKHIQGLQDMSYSDRLSYLNLYSVKGRLLRADLIKYWKILHRYSAVQPESLFVLAPSVGTRGHSYKLFPSHRNLESRRRFFSQRRIELWNSLPAQVTESNTLTSLKRLLHNALHTVLFEFDY